MKKDISIKKIYNEIVNNIKIIFLSTIFFSILGMVISLSMDDVYTASSTFYPHYEKNQNNNLRNLAGLAGIDLSSANYSEVPTSLYPNLINSTPFKNQILREIISYEDKLFSYGDYLLKEKFKTNIDTVEIKNNTEYSKNEFIKLSDNEFKLHNYLNNVIKINVNSIDGYIDLKVNDKNPRIAAIIAQKALEILQSNVIEYKLGNIKSVYNFTKNQLNDTKAKLYKLQDSLAVFKDRNISIKSDLFNNQLDRIETEYSLYKSIYNEIAIAKEKIAIDVQKKTPIFTIINPVTLPKVKSAPNTKLIIILSTFIGLTISLFFVIFKNELVDFFKS